MEGESIPQTGAAEAARERWVVQTFEASLTPRQQQVLELLGVPLRAYRS
jgi:hypothetical protein